MGDPRLVAGYCVIAVLTLDRAGAQGAEIGAGVWFCEHGGRQRFGGGNARQPFGLLFFGAARDDQFRRDLGAGRKRADPDVAARQLFGDNAHGRFGQAKAAVFFRDGQAENAHLGQLIDDLHRDQLVFEVPFMRKRLDLFGGIAAKLIANHFKVFVQTRCTDGRVRRLVLHQCDKPAARGLRVATLGQGHDCGIHQAALFLLAKAEILKPDDLALVHLDTAVNLPEVFTKRDLVDQLFGFTEFSVGLKGLGPRLHLSQGLCVCGKPRKTVCGRLIGLDHRIRDLSVAADQGAHGFCCAFEDRLDRSHRGGCQRQQILKENRCLHIQLSVMCHLQTSFSAYRSLNHFAGAAQQRYV